MKNIYTEDMKEITTSSSILKELITYDMVYVDKTSYIWRMVKNPARNFYFISRPRRFGKSLFCDTLRNVFEGNRELFRGLYIYDKHDFEPYPVLSFNFANVSSATFGNFMDSITKAVRKEAERNGVDIELSDNPAEMLQDALIGIYEKTGKGSVIIIDEYPYMSSSVEHADSLLQHFMDGPVKETGSKVVICGSQLSSMLEKVHDVSNPLYSRFGITLEVKPMSFHDCCLFHGWMDDLDQIRMYMLFGGMPSNHFEPYGNTFRDVIERKFLARGLPYKNLAKAILGSEAAEIDANESILRAIASGVVGESRIATETGLDQVECHRLIRKLESLGIIERMHPMANAPKRPRYRIGDALMGLWYTVFDSTDESDMPYDVDERFEMFRENLDSYFDHRFELFCMEYIRSNYICDEIGSWWGMSKDEDGKPVGADIDIVAKVRQSGKRFTIYAECKFRHRPMKLSDLQTLMNRTRDLDDTANYVLFSAGGFERQLRAVAWRHGAVMIGIDELMGRVPAPSLLEPVRPPEYSEDDDDERGR